MSAAQTPIVAERAAIVAATACVCQRSVQPSLPLDLGQLSRIRRPRGRLCACLRAAGEGDCSGEGCDQSQAIQWIRSDNLAQVRGEADAVGVELVPQRLVIRAVAMMYERRRQIDELVSGLDGISPDFWLL